MSRRPWSLALAAALIGHGAVAASLIAVPVVLQPPQPAGAAILLELPPAPPPATKTPAAKPEAPKAAKAKPVVKTKPKIPAPKHITPAAMMPLPHPQQSQPAADTKAPDPTAAHASAAPPGALPAQPDPQAIPNWQGLLLAHLEKHKRFPPEAQARRQRGQVMVTFSMDRSGHVIARSVKLSSGHGALDDAALDMLDRAQPLPPPPDEIQGSELHLTVPVRFSLN